MDQSERRTESWRSRLSIAFGMVEQRYRGRGVGEGMASCMDIAMAEAQV
jgi:hypothetical protein